MVEHRGIGGLQPREQPALVRAVAVPRLHEIIARRHKRVGRHQPGLLHRGEAALALYVPAVGELCVIVADQLLRRLMRRVACAIGEPQQERRVGLRRDVIGDEADRLVGQVGGEVIAAGVCAGRRHHRVVAHQLGRILIGLGVHEAVEAIEPAPQRPAIDRPRRPGLAQRRNVPFADHVAVVAMRAQHLRQRARLAPDLAAIAGITAVEIGEAAHADRMVIAPRHQRGAGGGAHRGGVEAGIAHPARRDRVDRRGADRRAVAAEVREADVVEQDDDDVRRPLRRARRAGPVRRMRRRQRIARAHHRKIPMPDPPPPPRRGSFRGV